MNTILALLLAVTCCLPGLTQAAVTFGDYPASEFVPARGQTFAISIRLDQAAEVEVVIFTSDGEPVRTLRSAGPLQPGTHTLNWDGKDQDGVIVPDEAYVPVIKTKAADGQEQVLDPRTTSSGEVVDDLRVEITPSQDIAYYLPAPCRVLIRAGIKGGPMLRSLATWEPRGPGKNIQRWDGRDSNGLLDIRTEPKLGILVTAFRLPEHAIITTGNTATGYRAYRALQGWPEPVVRPEDQVLARGTVRLSRHYYQPRAQDADPRVTLTLPEELPRSAEGLPLVKLGQSIPIKADIVKADRWLMNESLYEVAFFIDHTFMSEEEQGYVPLTWLWQVNGLSPGQHVVTVNVTGFSGKVGVASRLFVVVE